jgi:ferredoxin
MFEGRRMRVRIDPERCQGHLRCSSLAPAVFDTDDEGKGVVRQPEPDRAFWDDAHRAARACPERAIEVVERS